MIKKNSTPKLLFLLSILTTLCMQSCVSQVHYVLDNGKSYKEKGFEYRYSIVPIEDVGLEIKVFQKEGSSEGFLTITRTPFSPLSSAKDSVLYDKLIIVNLSPSFPGGNVLERRTRYDPQFKTENTYFTCDNFSQIEKKSNRLLSEIEYDIYAKESVTHHEFKYELIKRKSYRVGLH